MALKESAGIDLCLIEISPHRSDNFHSKLYETMLIEYALGTTWHDRAICDGLLNTRILSLVHVSWNDKNFYFGVESKIDKLKRVMLLSYFLIAAIL